MNRDQLELLLRYIDRVIAIGQAPQSGGSPGVFGGIGGGMGGSSRAAEGEQEKNLLRQAFRDAERGVVIDGEFQRIGD